MYVHVQTKDHWTKRFSVGRVYEHRYTKRNQKTIVMECWPSGKAYLATSRQLQREADKEIMAGWTIAERAIEAVAHLFSTHQERGWRR